MNFVKKCMVYFSPTCNTKKAVELVGTIWDLPEIIVDLSDRNTESCLRVYEPNDLCIVGVPSFGGRVPETALDRMKYMTGQNTPVILIATYGNRNYDDTLLELKNTLESKGFIIIAAMAVVAEHSIISQFATGRPNEKDKANIIHFAENIKSKLDSKNYLQGIKVKGNMPYHKYNGIPLKPYTGRECTKCGLCVSNCPVKAISEYNSKETDSSKCIFCMRCVKLCPNKARKINQFALFLASKMLSKICSVDKGNEIFL